jgi:segregation and condensation protein A
LTETEQYLVSYDKYRGPVKLLLELVQSKKADIYHISLSHIVKGFLDFIKKNESVAIDTLSGFIWTVSTLMEIKSRSLLPSKNREDKHEEPTQEILRRREQDYRLFLKISCYLDKVRETEELFLVREAPLEKEFMDLMPDFLEGLNLDHIYSLAERLLKDQPIQVNLGIVYNHRNIRTIYQEMKRVKQKLDEANEITFRDLADECKEVIDIIICFLSILELYKNEEVEILQFESFGNIIIKKVIKNG